MQKTSVRKLLGETVRILGSACAHMMKAVADLWYADPVWSLELTAAEEAANQAANQAIESVVAELVQVGAPAGGAVDRTVCQSGTQWPDGEPTVALEGAGFERFTSLESIFSLPFVNVRHRQQRVPRLTNRRRTFLDALLRQWDRYAARSGGIFEGDLPTIHESRCDRMCSGFRM